MRNFFTKMRGDGAVLPPRPDNKSIALAWLGGVIVIALLLCLTNWLSVLLILGSFGATCVLVFGFPDYPFSQPRNILFGHVFSSTIGLLFLYFLGDHWWALSLACGTTIATMMFTRTVHPPAGSNPVIIFLTQPGWDFLIFPTLLGALIIIFVALIYNNITRESNYPKYW